MENITTTTELRYAIEMLEADQFYKEQVLKEHLYNTLEELKPINLLTSTLEDISSLPVFSNSILGPAAGLATGYLSRILIVGGSVNIFRKILGTLVQFGVTNFVSRHPEGVKTLSNYILQRIFHKDKEITEKSDQQWH